jgi:hypothetical protein
MRLKRPSTQLISVRLRSMRPRTTRLMEPVSSLTTDDDGIGLLADANRRPVAGAVALESSAV